jgi:aspartokinase
MPVCFCAHVKLSCRDALRIAIVGSARMTDRLLQLCRELRTAAETSGGNPEPSRQAITKIIAELDSIDELQRLREVAWRKQQERFSEVSRNLHSSL